MNKKCITGVIVVGVLLIVSGCKVKEQSINKDVYPHVAKTSNQKEDFSRTKEDAEETLDNDTGSKEPDVKGELKSDEQAKEMDSENKQDNLQQEDKDTLGEIKDEEDQIETQEGSESVDERGVLDEEKLEDQNKTIEKEDSTKVEQQGPNINELTRAYANTYFYQLKNTNDREEFLVNTYDPTLYFDEYTYYSSNAHRLVNVHINNTALEKIGFEQNYWYDYNDKFIAYVDENGHLIYYNRYTKKKKDLHAENIAYLRVIDNCIYYYSIDEKALYCYKNGQHRKIVEGDMSYYEIVGNKVYYGSDYLNRANLDGSNLEIISEIPINALISINDVVFYMNDADVNALFRMTNTDTKGQLFAIIPVSDIEDYFSDDDKLFIHYRDQGKDIVDAININSFNHQWKESLNDLSLDYVSNDNYFAIYEEFGQGDQGTDLNIYSISPYQLVKKLTDCRKVGFIWKDSIYYISTTNNEVKKYDIEADSIDTLITEDYSIEELYLENEILHYGPNKENIKTKDLQADSVSAQQMDDIEEANEIKQNEADNETDNHETDNYEADNNEPDNHEAEPIEE